MMFVIYICDVREMYVLVVDSVCDGIYMYLSIVWMQINKQKKFKISLVFAEGLDHSPRQRISQKK